MNQRTQTVHLRSWSSLAPSSIRSKSVKPDESNAVSLPIKMSPFKDTKIRPVYQTAKLQLIFGPNSSKLVLGCFRAIWCHIVLPFIVFVCSAFSGRPLRSLFRSLTPRLGRGCKRWPWRSAACWPWQFFQWKDERKGSNTGHKKRRYILQNISAYFSELSYEQGSGYCTDAISRPTWQNCQKWNLKPWWNMSRVFHLSTRWVEYGSERLDRKLLEPGPDEELGTYDLK